MTPPPGEPGGVEYRAGIPPIETVIAHEQRGAWWMWMPDEERDDETQALAVVRLMACGPENELRIFRVDGGEYEEWEPFCEVRMRPISYPAGTPCAWPCEPPAVQQAPAPVAEDCTCYSGCDGSSGAHQHADDPCPVHPAAPAQTMDWHPGESEAPAPAAAPEQAPAAPARITTAADLRSGPRNPPSTQRADRLAVLEAEVARLRAQIEGQGQAPSWRTLRTIAQMIEVAWGHALPPRLREALTAALDEGDPAAPSAAEPTPVPPPARRHRRAGGSVSTPTCVDCGATYEEQAAGKTCTPAAPPPAVDLRERLARLEQVARTVLRESSRYEMPPGLWSVPAEHLEALRSLLTSTPAPTREEGGDGPA